MNPIQIVLLLGVTVTYVYSVCVSGKFWNPLNNACVDGKHTLMQCVLGTRPTSTMLTTPPTDASLPAPPLLHATLTISIRAV